MEEPISFIPEARKYFDERAELLIKELKICAPNMPSKPVPHMGSLGEIPISGHIDANQISNLRIEMTDGLGNFCGFEIHEKHVHEALYPEAAKDLIKLSQKVSEYKNLRLSCSTEYIRKHLIDWIINRRLGKSANISWTSELVLSLQNEIEKICTLIPLEGISLIHPLEFGRIRLSYFTKEWMDDFLEKARNRPELSSLEQKLRKQYQGHVYAEYRCNAEPVRAYELARHHTNRALEILRILHPAARDIEIRCFLGSMGQVAVEQAHHFSISSKGRSLSHGLVNHLIELNMCESFFSRTRNLGLWKANELLRKDSLTKLETDILEAISHYAHGVMSPYPQDRLLHALVAIESLLLKDGQEPIQSALSFRVAYLTGKDFEGRKQAEKEFMEAYALRSAFVHHGTSPKDVQNANAALRRCWLALESIINSTPYFKSKQELIKALDDKKFMG